MILHNIILIKLGNKSYQINHLGLTPNVQAKLEGVIK